MNYELLLLAAFMLAGPAKAQHLPATEDSPEPLHVAPQADTARWNTLDEGLHLTWASRDEHYALHEIPEVQHQTEAVVRAWRGERANIQAVLFSRNDLGRLSLRMTPVRKGRKGRWAEARFVNYLITDGHKWCGQHSMDMPTWLVPDIIDLDKPHAVNARQTRPVWCTIEVPHDARPGRYDTRLEVLDERGKVTGSLLLHIDVNHRTLPRPHEQRFHLDLWQQPYAVSRYYGLERWSPEHIEALRPYLKALGRAGQKVVSAIMFYEPWGDQSHDKFSAMIQSTKRKDGTWTYDYTIFDRYVTLCAECGIDAQINCYSMVPWDMTFRYYDEAQGRDIDLKTTTQTPEYRELWENFLKAFRKHLEEKGWFDKTRIAMDERAEADMLNAYRIAKEAGFRMALAGNYHASLTDKLHDYSVAPTQVAHFKAEERALRKAQGLITTFYTCCAEVEPNIYSNSLPAEAAFLPLHAAANDLDGYLHWSWINWDDHPLTDSRFRLFGSGDTYNFYPGPRSSVRFERLIEGIQQYEKVQVLKLEWQHDPIRLARLESLLQECQAFGRSGKSCAETVNKIETFLNEE